jgi:hypothetical protein
MKYRNLGYNILIGGIKRKIDRRANFIFNYNLTRHFAASSVKFGIMLTKNVFKTKDKWRLTSLPCPMVNKY